MQSDGKFIVGGAANVNNVDFALARYDSNGDLDLSFNGIGTVTTDFGGSPDDRASGIAVQTGGKIVVVGASNIFPYTHMAMARYTIAGSLDMSFGGTGKVLPSFGFDYEDCKSVALQSDGRIVVVGYARNNGNVNPVFAVARYLSDGGSFTPFQQWKFTQLGDLNAPDLGDTDFDGLVHLAEYALNLSPTAPSLPPPAERHLYAEGERLRMFFTRDPARNDVTIEVQAADSPAGPWTSVAASTLGGLTAGPGYVGGDDATPGLKTAEVRDTVNISPAAASRYLRVKVTH